MGKNFSFLINLFKKGHYETRTNTEVVARINEIENYINTYRNLKTQISSLAEALMNSAFNLENSYNLVSEAVVIGDIGYVNSISKIGTTASKMRSTAESLYSLIGSVDNEIDLLIEEKNSLEPKKTYKIFVED